MTDRAEMLRFAPTWYEDDLADFMQAEPMLVTQVMPAFLTLYKRFSYWLYDHNRIDIDEARELLDALRLLEQDTGQG